MSKNILIVDDQNGIRILLTEVFRAEGYKTYQASHARLALDIVKNTEIDLILLDIVIPGDNGIRILKEVKKLKPCIYVILMTAHEVQAEIDEGFALGVQTCFIKPFDIDEMRQAVEQTLYSAVELPQQTIKPEEMWTTVNPENRKKSLWSLFK